MANFGGFQFALTLLVLVAMTGLIGFVIIYHNASFERPMEHFAIVIDAGSTQTRSSLFAIELDVENLVRWTNEIDDDGDFQGRLPLTRLFQVKQVGSCTNGAPLASIKSEPEAQELVDKCLREFKARVVELDQGAAGDLVGCPQNEDDPQQALNVLDHRVNSVTHLYLGATAGMRALEEVDVSRASEKIRWINQAINRSREMQPDQGPAINKGFVGVISGSDEASFGWTSVNFLCETLEAQHGPRGHLEHSGRQLEKAAIVYKTDETPAVEVSNYDRAKSGGQKHKSVGTLELGGTSAQMAYEIGENFDLSDVSATGNSTSFQLEELELFNGKYSLATRSDLCLGMSQAILRANFIILRDQFDATQQQATPTFQQQNESQLELINPCLQNSSKTLLSGSMLTDFLESPCLVEPITMQDNFKKSTRNKSLISFVGTGNAEQCSKLLTHLIEPNLCAKYFSLCPRNKNRQPPPSGVPFVTISGYNHALVALTHLTKSRGSLEVRPSNRSELELVIGEKLGGHSIDHSLFLEETSRFCSLEADSLIETYNIDEHYYKVQCLQLVYINKLLTEFYHFDPKTSWRQIKFLLSPPEAERGKQQSLKLNNTATATETGPCSSAKMEIGWTLGLLLNATSHQLDEEASASALNNGTLFYHHGTSVIFILRTTLVLMFACILLAICFIVTAVVSVRHQQRKAYISPTGTSPRDSVQSSWCSSLEQI